MKTLARMEKSWNCWFLILTSFIFFFFRLPSLLEPYWYGDEGIYQVLGMGIKKGLLLYRDIFDNKPPFLYATYSIFNGDQFAVRALNLIFGVLAILAFFYLSKKLFIKDKIAYISTGIFAFLLAIPALEGNIANAENFMMPIILLAGLMVYKNYEKLHEKTHNLLSEIPLKLFLAGILLSIAFLFKIVALFDFAAFFLFLIFSDTNFSFNKIKKIGNIFSLSRKLSLFAVGFFLPIAATSLFFYIAGAFPEFARATFFSNVGYVGYGNKLIIPQGFLILKLLLLGGFSLFVIAKKEKLTPAGIFIYLWLAFSLFNAFFSQRPYTHYLLTLLPSFCLFVGFVFSNKKWQKLSLLILVIITYLTLKSFNVYDKNIAYYQNFFSFINGTKTASKYEAFFDRRTPIDYQLADYINQQVKKEDNIYIWGNNAQLYKLTNKMPPGKYTVAYHVSSYKDGISNTYDGLIKSKPKLIIVMPNSKPFPFSLLGYLPKAIISDVIVYERTY